MRRATRSEGFSLRERPRVAIVESMSPVALGSRSRPRAARRQMPFGCVGASDISTLGGSVAPAMSHSVVVGKHCVEGGPISLLAKVDELARRLLRHFTQMFIEDVAHAEPFQIPQQIRHLLPLRPGLSGDMTIASSRSLPSRNPARASRSLPQLERTAPCTTQLSAHVEDIAVKGAYLRY